MSNQQNTQLLELAEEHLTFWGKEGIAKVIESDLDRGDYEALEEHLKISANMIFIEEFATTVVNIDVQYYPTKYKVKVSKSLIPNTLKMLNEAISKLQQARW